MTPAFALLALVGLLGALTAGIILVRAARSLSRAATRAPLDLRATSWMEQEQYRLRHRPSDESAPVIAGSPAGAAAAEEEAEESPSRERSTPPEPPAPAPAPAEDLLSALTPEQRAIILAFRRELDSATRQADRKALYANLLFFAAGILASILVTLLVHPL